MIRIKALTWILLGAVLAGCAGSHSSALPATAASSAPAKAQKKTGTAQFSLLIPNRPATSSGTRHAQYVSASTLSGTIAVNGGALAQLDLGTSSGTCTTATNGRTCLIAAPAPIGTDSFALTLYDGAYTAGQHTGNALSTASNFTATVAEGTANVTTPLELSGIPAFYALTVTQEPVAYATSGSAASGAAVLDVYDADLNLIVGPGTYADGSGAVTGFTIGLSSSNYMLALNGGANAYTQHITAPSDVLTITQTHATLGAQLTVTPDAGAQASANTAYIRPQQFSTGNIESSLDAPSAVSIQLAPIANQTYGVAGYANSASIEMFTTDSTTATVTTCGPSYAREQDFASNVATGWYTDAANGYTYTIDNAGCNPNQQFLAQSVVGYEDGVLGVDATCTASYQYTPGVEISPGTGSPASCTLIHDLTAGTNTSYFAAAYTSGGTVDQIAVYNITAFNEAVPLSNSFATAAGGSIAALAGRPDYFFAEELPAARLWRFPNPAGGLGGGPGFLYLPGGYTYVGNADILSGHAFSQRTMATGSDGLLYVAVSSPSNGVLVVDPVTCDLVTFLPNPGAAASSTVFNVVSDVRGTIYWSAGPYLMHYPSGVSTS